MDMQIWITLLKLMLVENLLTNMLLWWDRKSEAIKFFPKFRGIELIE